MPYIVFAARMPAKSAPRIISFGLNNPKVNLANNGFNLIICQSAGLA
jgi:hypothetical protein